MTPGEILLIVLFGTLAGFDTVSFPQGMISRPIVAATLGGAATGDAGLGVLCGAILECFAVETLPVGASRYPEWGSASVVAGALFADERVMAGGALVIAVVVGLAGAWLGGWSMVQLRTLNAKRARKAQEAVARGEVHVIRQFQLTGLASDLVRATALTLLLLAVALPLRDTSILSWSHSLGTTRLIVAVIAAAVAASAVWKHFSTIAYARSIFAAALAAGFVLYFLV
ncbi:MAG TPA: PTS sugar transporter subunit IIC [Gemmatimonadaceae bacterium]|nr:PTS sugar transporter subunit IIC [Gemmatimonadaceae bacterium]